MDEKFLQAIKDSPFSQLPRSEQQILEKICGQWNFSFQQIRLLILMAIDLQKWGGSNIDDLLKHISVEEIEDRKRLFTQIEKRFHQIRDTEKNYKRYPCTPIPKRELTLIETQDDHQILGSCPVASSKTRCCNLKTLDAIRNCGFDCSYCSIQSFYYDDRIYFDGKLEEKLEKLQLDPNQIYHIGTGQSSDSLMWGNRDGLLDKLFAFARKNPNAILELKSKSANTKDLLTLDIPPNVICTWSLNTQTLIDNEEHHTAGLEERIKAAERVAAKNRLVGFHFHPMVIYDGHQAEYQDIAHSLMNRFAPEQLAMISLGTLTFIKPVLKKIRARDFKSKILQMPMVEIAGKYSYPLEQKEELFKTFYQSFSAEWREKVFFYLCMEDPALWSKVFSREYRDNEEFEKEMIQNYFQKISRLKN